MESTMKSQPMPPALASVPASQPTQPPEIAESPSAAAPSVAGKIGPNALIQTVHVLQAQASPDEVAAVLHACGLERLLTEMPSTMVDEQEFFDLADTLAAQRGATETQAILREAGRLTGDYLLAHRIPRPFQRLLHLMPRRAAMKLLMTAIRKHAWTFVGSGDFTYTLGRRPQLTIACSSNVTSAVCGFYGGTFERLFQTLVDAEAQVEMITTPPIVRTYCVYRVLYGPQANGPQPYGPESYRPEGEVA